MIDHDAIRRGIRVVLSTVTGLPTVRSWENREFNPTPNTPWIRETLIPGTERQVATDVIESVGIAQYDLFWPAGTGTETPEQLADLIKDTFQPITTVAASTVVWRAERLAAIADAKWYQIPIRLTWRSHAVG